MSNAAELETPKEKFDRYGLHIREPELWDNTISSAFGECNRLGWYQHALGLVPKTENYSFTWGKVYHKITEIWNVTRSPDAITQVIMDFIPEHVEDRYKRTRSRMMELFVAWAEFCEKNPLKILHNEQSTVVACLDDPCPYSDHGCGLVYGGRLDVIADWNGIVGPLDRKTSVSDDADPIAEYKPSQQMEGYTWISSHLIGRHCWGVILEKAVCNSSKLIIKRHPISYSKDMIREWVGNEIRRQRRIRDRLRSPDAYRMEEWEQNYFRCYKPFQCAYRDLCTSPIEGDFRFKMMRDQYVEARWDFKNPNQRDEVRAEAIANEL
jgi:hypothetical protein